MKIYYISFFRDNDKAEQPLKDYLADLQSGGGTNLVIKGVRDALDLGTQLSSLKFDDVDILIIGGHGHNSLTGCYIGDEPVRWHELASSLKGRLPITCSFIFYSCNGGYPGIAHVLYGASGPNFIFGPSNHVDSDAMKYAVRQIVDWRRKCLGTPDQARDLVDAVNEWAKSMYPDRPYDQSFLRVQWREGHTTLRHPIKRGPDRPKLPPIPLKTSA